MALAIVLTIILVILGFIECRLHRKNLERVPLRILVNGTRGKTSTAILVAEALSLMGVRTFAKTTGSEARIILPDGKIVVQNRRRGARVTEMIPFMRLAAGGQAQAVVVECMALVPENQRLFARQLLRPTHVLITNAYHDHAPEMGESLDEVVWTLAQSVPSNAALFALDGRFGDCCRNFHLVEKRHYETVGKVPLYDDNTSLAVALVESLGGSVDTVLAAATRVVPDSGLYKEIRGKNGAIFIPGFAKNDLESMEGVLKLHTGKRLHIIFSNRADREYRVKYLVEILLRNQVECVHVMGDYKRKIASYIKRKTGLKIEKCTVESMADLINSSGEAVTFLGLGNIKGDGEALVARFISIGEETCSMRQ